MCIFVAVCIKIDYIREKGKVFINFIQQLLFEMNIINDFLYILEKIKGDWVIGVIELTLYLFTVDGIGEDDPSSRVAVRLIVDTKRVIL